MDKPSFLLEIRCNNVSADRHGIPQNGNASRRRTRRYNAEH